MVKGVEALHRRLAAAAPRIEAAVRPVMERYAAQVVAQMQAIAPENTGRLRDAIKWRWGEAPAGALALASFSGGRAKGLHITIYVERDPAFYAAFIEFGTQKMTAQPFFFPVWRANRSRIKGGIARAARKAWAES